MGMHSNRSAALPEPKVGAHDPELAVPWTDKPLAPESTDETKHPTLRAKGVTNGPQAYLHGASLAIATIALALGNFMQVLDTTIANVSIPSIAGDLGVSAHQGTWIITSYAISNAISILLSGWLAQRFGQVRVFVIAVLCFTLASGLAALSVSFTMLLAARVLQGSVSGLMVPLSQALLIGNYPARERGRALAVWSMTVVIAPVVGPILGGWLTDNAGWPWIFYINIPVGLVVATAAWKVLGSRDTKKTRVPVDGIGLALIVIWVGALQIMLDTGNELNWFDSATITGLAITAALGCVVFIIWETNNAHPIVQLRLFRIHNFLVGTVILAAGFGVFFGSIVLIPLWLQTQMGYTATWAGLVLAPAGVLAAILSPAVGKNIGRIDPRWFASFAFVVFTVCSFLRAGYSSDADYASLAWPQWLLGIGVAAFFAPMVAITQGDLAPEDVAFGAGLMNFMRTTAGSFGASLAVTFWDWRTAFHHGQLVKHIATAMPHIPQLRLQLSQAGLTARQVIAQVEELVNQQASVLAADDIFRISGWLFLLLVAAVWLAHKPARVKTPAH